MGIFSIIVIIPIVVICALLGIVCLKVAKLPTSLLSVTIFTGTGSIVGVATIIVWGFIFSNDQGQLDSTAKILSMFVAAGIFAVIAGIYASSMYSKHNKPKQSDALKRASV